MFRHHTPVGPTDMAHDGKRIRNHISDPASQEYTGRLDTTSGREYRKVFHVTRHQNVCGMFLRHQHHVGILRIDLGDRLVQQPPTFDRRRPVTSDIF